MSLHAILQTFPAEVAYDLLRGLMLSANEEFAYSSLDADYAFKLLQWVNVFLLHSDKRFIFEDNLDKMQKFMNGCLEHIVAKAGEKQTLKDACIELKYLSNQVLDYVEQQKLNKTQDFKRQLAAIERNNGLRKIIVCSDPFPPSSDRADGDILKRYERLRSPMPLVSLPEIDQLDLIERTLKQEFPWGHWTVDAIMDELKSRRSAGSKDLFFQPKIIYGSPGSGKNRFIRRLAELLEQPFTTLSLGGHGDTKIISGTARGWGSAQPSSIIELIMTRQCANPLVILDEIDKIGPSRWSHGGNIASLLLQFLERENASNFCDMFLQVRCNLSHVNYIATANSLEALPPPLVSRMKVLPMPTPQPEHFPMIFNYILKDQANNLGLPDTYFDDCGLSMNFDMDSCHNIRDVQRQVQNICNTWILEKRYKQRLH